MEIINENRQKFEKEHQQGFLILFPSGAYQSAIGSGFLSLLDSKLQYNLASTYAGFKWVESVSSRVLSMIGGVDMSVTNYSDNLKAFQAVIDTQLKRLQEAIPSLVKEVISQQIEVQDASVSKVTSTSTAPQGTAAGVQANQNPNRDIDLHKIDVAASHRLGILGAMMGAYFAFIIGLLVAWYQRFVSGDIVTYYTGVALIGGVLAAMLVTQELIPYKNWFKQIDGWYQIVESGQRLPEVKELIRFRDRLQSMGHLILIFLVVVEFYVLVVGNYDKLQVFIGFSTVGIIVALLTQGGPQLLRNRRTASTTP